MKNLGKFVNKQKNKLRCWLDPRTKNSYVENLNLIAKNSKIITSTLIGKVKVDEHVILKDVTIHNHSEIHVSIGRYTRLTGPNTRIRSILNPVSIGNFSSIASNVSFQEYNHFTDRVTTYYVFQNVFNEWDSHFDKTSKGPIRIGHDVWIGMNTTILSGVRLGDGVIIGANSVVTHDIEPYTIAAGVPTRMIKQRFSQEIIDELLKLQWWYWSRNKILKNRSLFEGKLTMEKIKNVIEFP